MTTNQYIFQTFNTGDIGRMGAQVISGIGFLGAGTIIITGRNQVRGLTTAAGLWASACIGLSIGIGFYEGAILGGITIFFVMTILHKMDNKMRKKSNLLHLYLEFSSSKGLGSFLSLAKRNSIEVSDIQIVKNKEIKDISVLLSVKTKENRSHKEILQMLSNTTALNCIYEI